MKAAQLFFLGSCLCLTLSACGDDGAPEGGTETETGTGTETGTSTSTSTTTTSTSTTDTGTSTTTTGVDTGTSDTGTGDTGTGDTGTGTGDTGTGDTGTGTGDTGTGTTGGGGNGYGECPNGDDDCEANETCVTDQGGDWTICTPGTCDNDGDCDVAGFPGQLCADAPGDGQPQDYCLPSGCDQDDDCPTGMQCFDGFMGNPSVCLWPT